MRQVLMYPGEDGYWVVECPSLPGCISQGKTRGRSTRQYSGCDRFAYRISTRQRARDTRRSSGSGFGGCMTKLPIISGNDCIKALQKAAFVAEQQTGNHVVMERPEPLAQTVVPKHKDWIAAH